MQDSRFWGPGSDSDDDSDEEEVTSSEEGSDVSDSDSDSSDDDNAAGCVTAEQLQQICPAEFTDFDSIIWVVAAGVSLRALTRLMRRKTG